LLLHERTDIRYGFFQPAVGHVLFRENGH
jgi:hypothetical protein